MIALATQDDANFNSYKCAIGHCRTNSGDVGDIVFLSRNIQDSSTCSMADERMRIASNGSVGIGRTNPTELLHVNGNFKAEGSVVSGSGGDIISGNHIVTTATHGRLGIGINSYSTTSIVHLHRTTTNTEVKLQFTDGTTLSTATDGLTLYKGTNQIGYLWNYENADLAFGTNNTERMRIASNGNIGIGTNNPLNLLHIHKNESAQNVRIILSDNTTTASATRGLHLIKDSTNISYLWNYENTALGFATNSMQRMTIASNGNVIINGNLNVGSLTNPSDSRIKKDIEDINDDTALNKLLLIQPTTYNYIEEERNKGFGKVYGFIAQQIKEVIPEAVPIIQYVIPNIYKSCLINNKREVYHSIPLDTPIDTEVKIKGSTYKIKEIYEDYFVIDNDIDSEEVFVFGYSVDDFHTLNKDYIFTLNVCATQELHRRIEAHEDRIKDLEEKVERLLTNT